MAACSLQGGNLGCASQSDRLRKGVIFFALALVVATVLLKMGLGTGYRLALFVPFGLAANLIYMGLYKT
jgi:hypothetical protein